MSFKPMNLGALMSTPIGGPSVKHGAVTAKVTPAFPLNPDQQAAVAAMLEHINNGNDPFFLLQGPAGTGKTFCVKDLVNKLRGRMVFTAPTNKATKVLRESIQTDDYRPDCRTIYSLLGLRLEANGEIKELTTPEEPLDLTKFLAVVVDEASMVNSKLWGYIKDTARSQGIPFIFMGDPAQLPPVGEARSPVWSVTNKAELTKVMRHDNEILKLATAIRMKVDHPAPTVKIETAHADGEGVWAISSAAFYDRIADYARAGEFSKPNSAKAIAWRNVTVEQLNTFIRKHIFDNAHETRWLEGDRIIMLEPAKDMEGENMASTDDEGTVTRVVESYHPLYGEFKCYVLSVTFDDNRTGSVWLLHEQSQFAFNREVERRAMEARANGKLWKKFWEFKSAFHSARHAYAITAHRAQGSTYMYAFVDYRDILLNRNRQEAFRCLYVGCTRPKRRLYLA